MGFGNVLARRQCVGADERFLAEVNRKYGVGSVTLLLAGMITVLAIWMYYEGLLKS